MNHDTSWHLRGGEDTKLTRLGNCTHFNSLKEASFSLTRITMVQRHFAGESLPVGGGLFSWGDVTIGDRFSPWLLASCTCFQECSVASSLTFIMLPSDLRKTLPSSHPSRKHQVFCVRQAYIRAGNIPQHPPQNKISMVENMRKEKIKTALEHTGAWQVLHAHRGRKK